MSDNIEKNSSTILSFLVSVPRGEGSTSSSTGAEIEDSTGLSANEINDAVTILYESGFVDWLQTFGTAPYDFNQVEVTARGRYEAERLSVVDLEGIEDVLLFPRPPSPVGSPFGFTDLDWETVADRKARKGVVQVVMGHQFESGYYDTEDLLTNIERMLQEAIAQYNLLPGAILVELEFLPLVAGYGEHLFNEIARDIISADIAIFETSDLNPNVMVEMGVALTWGVRVLPIKQENRPKPPSDISGQTWADYRESGSAFVDPDHMRKMVRMIERAARKKGPA